MIGTWDYATYGSLATYVLTLQSGGGGGGGGTSYTTYTVKVVTNVLNQNVYSIQAPSSNFYTQPVLSFGAGDQFLFDIQDATYSAASAALVFGTTVDDANTINTGAVSTVNNNILLTLDSAYSGSNLVYFDSGTANMGYVAPPSGTTYTVTVANGVYSFASGGSTVTPSFTNGTTYIFDLADATNTGQQFVLGSTLDDTSTLFSTQTIMGTPGQTGAYVSYTPNYSAVAYFSYSTTGMGATISQADYEYTVKTVTNVTGDVVYAFDTNGDGTFYNQPDLTFAIGSIYLFNTSQIASGYTLSFGTTVDGTPDTSVVTSGTNQLLLDLSAKTGDHYTYFDATNAGMGFVQASSSIYAGMTVTSAAGTYTTITNIPTSPNATDDYTLEFFMRANTAQNQGDVIISNNGNDFIVFYFFNSNQFFLRNAYYQATPLTVGTWYHVAVVQTSNTSFDLYLDGSKLSISSGGLLKTNNILDNTLRATDLMLFNWAAGNKNDYQFTGSISNVRLSSKKVYTGNFTVPQTPLQVTQNNATNISSLSSSDVFALIRADENQADTIVNESQYSLNISTGAGTVTTDVVGTVPNYAVTVSGNPAVFYLDNIAQPTLTFTSGSTYVFDQSDSSNDGHPLVIGTTADDNTTLVTQTVVGTPGQAGAYTQFTATATTVYYFCYNHSGMGA